MRAHEALRKTQGFLGCILILFFICLSIRCSNDNSKPVTEENAKKGEVLFNSSGCTTCHSIKGESRYGPPLIFSYNQKIIVFHNDKKLSITLDRKYIIRSIKQPESEKLDGYQNKKMPSSDLSSEDINRIADYLIYLNTKGNP